MSETPNSGSPVDPSNGGTPPQVPPGGERMGDPADVEKNKIMACVAYLGILFLVPLVAAKDSPFAKYHANQGMALTIGAFAVYFLLTIVFIIVRFIPFLGVIVSCFGCLVFPLITIGYLVLVILGIVNAVNGKMKPLPMFPEINIIK